MVLQSQLELTPHRPDTRSLHVEREMRHMKTLWLNKGEEKVREKGWKRLWEKKKKGSGLCVSVCVRVCLSVHMWSTYAHASFSCDAQCFGQTLTEKINNTAVCTNLHIYKLIYCICTCTQIIQYVQWYIHSERNPSISIQHAYVIHTLTMHTVHTNTHTQGQVSHYVSDGPLSSPTLISARGFSLETCHQSQLAVSAGSLARVHICLSLFVCLNFNTLNSQTELYYET